MREVYQKLRHETMTTHRAKKRFGQNFLIDQGVIHAILQAIQPRLGDVLVEIGPGLGALTIPLLEASKTLTAIEIDRDIIHFFETHPQEGLHLIEADALAFDYRTLGHQIRLIGNLPYNISTPLLFHLLTFKTHLQDMHVMLQKEVVDRMIAKPGSKAYGRLSIALQYHCDITPLCVVPHHAFSPAPKVDSAVVRLTPYRHSPYDPVPSDALASIVQKAFQMRRKTLANNLKTILSPEDIKKLDINPSKRPEDLSIEEYVRITQYHISLDDDSGGPCVSINQTSDTAQN